MLEENVVDILFIRNKDLIYYVNQLTNARRLCIFKNCVKEILNIAHDKKYFEYVKTHDIVMKS